MKAPSLTIPLIAGALLLSLLAGAGLASLQGGAWLTGWIAFSFLFLLSFLILAALHRWAIELPPRTSHRAPGTSHLTSPVSKTFGILLALAFTLRLLTGTVLYFALPVDGYDDPDDRAGYVFTDAHRRDQQAWELASSDQPILSAFDRSFHTDQYGGLLAFSALLYRVFSPDAQRPLLLILVTAFIAALGLPFLWKAARALWGEEVALIASWIYVLYPESILLGGAAMREPYLMTFSAMALWGFVSWYMRGGLDTWRQSANTRPPDADSQPSTSNLQPPTGRRSLATGHWSLTTGLWLAVGLLGMLLVSPVVALVTLIMLAGWMYLGSERSRLSWWTVAAAALVFAVGLFLLSSSLNRQGEFDPSSPFAILGGFLREAVKWDVYQLERGSGWVQKLFDEMPAWLRLPFVTVYGVFQPVLPAAIVEPTTLTWKIVAILRALGWYALLPALVLALLTGAASGREKPAATRQPGARRVLLWLTVVCWFWILLTSLRGGGDQWDNPRYRAILFMWQAVVVANALIRARGLDTPRRAVDGARSPDTGNWLPAAGHWLLATPQRFIFTQIILCELIFLGVFTQWYASRYFHWGSQLPFAGMVALIVGLWGIAIAGGWIWLRKKPAR